METGDEYIINLYGEEYNRAPYFDYFFNKVYEYLQEEANNSNKDALKELEAVIATYKNK